MKNKLYTLSYFKKRLRDGNYNSITLFNSYSEDDQRYWTILIGEDNIQCTCLKFMNEMSQIEFSFHFTDNKQTLNMDKKVTTHSMNVILELLNNITKKDNTDASK